MDVSVLVFEDCTALAAVGPMELLAKSGRLHAHLAGGGQAPADAAPFFDVRLVSARGNPILTANGWPVHCHDTLETAGRADLVIVPALDGDIDDQLERNRAAVPWLRRMYEAGADLASVCTGAFVLAETGLLDGRSATTHWLAHDRFRARYPAVTLRPQSILVDEGRICTSGGATSFLNLVVYLVEKFCGPETAHAAASMFLIDVDKRRQGAYAIFSGQKDHEDTAIRRAQSLVEEGVGRPLTVESLAGAVALSKRTFIRRFKRATGNTPIEYIQRVRVEAAKKALATTDEPLLEVALRVGYEDLGSFRRVFARHAGMSPAAWRRRYRRPVSTWVAGSVARTGGAAQLN